VRAPVLAPPSHPRLEWTRHPSPVPHGCGTTARDGTSRPASPSSRLPFTSKSLPCSSPGHRGLVRSLVMSSRTQLNLPGPFPTRQPPPARSPGASPVSAPRPTAPALALASPPPIPGSARAGTNRPRMDSACVDVSPSHPIDGCGFMDGEGADLRGSATRPRPRNRRHHAVPDLRGPSPGRSMPTPS
jgi:hypothetical protein